MKLFSILSTLASLTTLAFAIPNPLPGSSNIQLRDPAIAYNPTSKKYFVFSTGSGIRTYTSTSLRGPWKAVGTVLPNCTVIKDISIKSCSLWAPDVKLINGQYALYYSVSQLGTQNSAIGVATSPSMEPGSWKDHGAVIRSKKGDAFNAIDGNIVVDNGKLKLGFGSWWGGIFQINLKTISTKAQNPPGTHLAGSNGRPSEGGFTYKPPSSPYWFEFFSDGHTPLTGDKTRPAPGQEYKVRVGRSKSSSGPFLDGSGHAITAGTHSGWNILGSHDNIYAPGGQSLFHDPVSKRDVIVYHYVKKNETVGGPSYLGINFVDFSSGEPKLVD